MKTLNKAFVLLLVIVALVPLIPVLLLAASPMLIAGLMLFGILGFGLYRKIFSFLWSFLSGLTLGCFRILFSVVGFLVPQEQRSARFMGWWGRLKTLSCYHQGMLVDGCSARLSIEASNKSLLVQGGMGAGKSSIFVMPNLLDPPPSRPSFVVTDTSGEIYAATSGYLTKKGYGIRVLNLTNSARSDSYNPLAAAQSPQAIAELAKILVKSSNPHQGGHQDPFWEQAAEKLLRILAQCLLNMGQPQFLNLANLRHLVLNFDAHVAPKGQLGRIDHFVLSATQQDPQTYASYQAFVQGNLKAIQSVLMSADVALDALASPEIASVTAQSSFGFHELRQRPTALYVMVNQTQMSFYAFLLNLFYTDLFRFLLSDLNHTKRPVWLFLDEFGHLSLPDFPVFASTARKYNVAFQILLQSLAQLETRYSPPEMKTIIEALGTEIYLPGMPLEVAQNLEDRLGQKAKGPLMPAHELIRMDRDQALMLHGNALPHILGTQRYFERSSLRRRAKKGAAPLPHNPMGMPPLIQI